MRYCLGDPSEYGALWAALAFMPFGLFFDFMDGKIARWRGKSSLMGQELDSLADLVRTFIALSLSFKSISNLGCARADFLWSRSRCRRLCPWYSDNPRSPLPGLLCSLWFDSLGAIQCHRCGPPEG